MERGDFEKIVAEEFPRAVPEKFRARLKNVAVLVEWEPSADIRREEELSADETLLGLYHGVPHTARGSEYGVGMTLPDTITLFQGPIEEEAGGDSARIREIVRDTIWHEVAHYFGMDEEEVRWRESKK